MSITYSELTSEVVANLEIDSSDLSRYQVVEKLNIAQWEIINALPFKWIANIIKTTKFNLLAPANPNNHLYQYPSDFVRFVEAWIDYANPITRDNKGVPLYEWVSDNHHQTIDHISTTKYPMIDIEKEGGFEISPAPTVAVTEGGALHYVWRVPAIAVAQPCLLNYNLKPLLVHRASELSALVDNYRPDLAGIYGKLFEQDMERFMPKREKR
jgi:hypothetical protein